MTIAPETLAELKALESKATQGHWKVWTSNSWRRIRSAIGCVDTGVIEPVMQRDGHPDLFMPDGNGEFICALRNAAPALIAAAEENARLREALSGILENTELCPDDPERAIVLSNGFTRWHILIGNARQALRDTQ